MKFYKTDLAFLLYIGIVAAAFGTGLTTCLRMHGVSDGASTVPLEPIEDSLP